MRRGSQFGGPFVLYHVWGQNAEESENSVSDPDLGHYEVLFVKVGNETPLSVSLMYNL